ncbi:hypothetical protein [Joostella sp. CR20]|uniref:hypothetical protein n=1 Tax=Joostella sp. CR20 TaxID=2804312 RepID=UPI00313E819B
MRRLVLASAFALGSFASFAATPVIFHDGIAEDIYATQDEYEEIQISEVPQAITEALASDFPGAEIIKAYKNEAAEYKIEVSAGGEATTLYADENGEWLQK